MSENCRPAEERPASESTKKKKKTEHSPTIAHATRSERAQRAERPTETSQLLQPGESITSNITAPIIQPLSYDILIDFHLERIRLDASDEGRSRAVLRNHRSVINGWNEFHLKKRGMDPLTGEGAGLLLIGDELITNFTYELADYLTNQEEQGKKKSTLADRKSIMRSVRESALELIRTWGLPEGFAECLTHLVEISGMSLYQIAKLADVLYDSLLDWTGGKEPRASSRPGVERLEEVLKVPPCTLTGRILSFEVVFVSGPLPTGSTPWREHQKKVIPLHYILKEEDVPALVRSEFQDLVLFHTDEIWRQLHGLECNSEWRIRLNRNTCPTAEKTWKKFKTFFGFLHLPTDSENPWVRGKGMAFESLSLALLSDVDLLIPFVEFKRIRTYLQAFNNETVGFLTSCAALLRKETGFLRQQPQYGSKLPNPISPDKWDEWCEKNHARIWKFIATIKKSKNRPVIMTRDPFAAVRNIIIDRDHPLDALLEMVANMKRLIPLKAKGCAAGYALHMRDITFGEFAASYPLRIENFTLLTWVPKNPADLLDPNKKYIETEDSSHLYQKPDGSWWIRFWSNEVKNGLAIDVPVAASVWTTLRTYLFQHRPVLNESLKRAINERRKGENLPLLTHEEERAIELCPFVFRPAHSRVYSMPLAPFINYKGTEQMLNDTLSAALYRMSQRYIPNCIGFHAHAVRHLVASEYIKNHPEGFGVAAVALNISRQMVEVHYAWVPPCKRLKPWQDYFQALRDQFEISQVLA